MICKSLLLFVFVLFENGLANWNLEQNSNSIWNGRWFPQPLGKQFDDNPTIEYNPESLDKDQSELYDSHHGIQMGVVSHKCDDGKTNISIDWDNNPVNFTCYESKLLYLPDFDVNPILTCEKIPEGYSAIHYCMEGPIVYNRILPTFGGHRPLWPKYGEYKFLPIQRWLHSLEHGAIVMLYHPCANSNEVQLLRTLVRNCLYRHVITPYNLLPPERPLALIAWGCRLEISKVDPEIVVSFIREYAKHGPEEISKDGQYSYGLKERAKYVTDRFDSELCPNVDEFNVRIGSM